MANTYKAENSFEPNCSEIVSFIDIDGLKVLSYENGEPFTIRVNDDRKWKIIKPIIKVKFAEAFKIFKNNTRAIIKSCLTGKSWVYNSLLFEEVTDDEVDNDWIVENIYN